MSWFSLRRDRVRAQNTELQISSVSQFLVNPPIWLMGMRREIKDLTSESFLAAQLDRIAVRISSEQASRQDQES